jgi:hypothetical protein
MFEPSTLGKFWILGVLTAIWLLLSHRAMRLNPNLAFHVAAYQRDQRKAKFYFLSVWAGLAAIVLSLLSQEALYFTEFDSALTRDWVFHVIRGVGWWGAMVVALVWSQVGQRVGQSNSDGKSLTPFEESQSRGRGDNSPNHHRR